MLHRNCKTYFISLFTIVAVSLFTSSALARSHAEDTAIQKDYPSDSLNMIYTLDLDPVSGELLSTVENPVIINHEGREFRFANEHNATLFTENPGQYLDNVNKHLIKSQLPHYPADTCPVSGQPLDSMGGGYNYLHQNRLVRFCCAGCINHFNSKADQYLSELDRKVIEDQRPAYPTTTCPVSGAELGGMGDPVEKVFANRLVRFCCSGCIDEFKKHPARYILKLDMEQPGKDE